MTEELFTQAALTIGLPISQLSLVLVADDARYGEAVDRVHLGAGYTNHASGYRGMAKTSMLHDPIAARVAPLSFIYTRSAVPWQRFSKPKGSSATRCRTELYFILYSRVGSLLRQPEKTGSSGASGGAPRYGFEISQFAQYHACIIEEEYAASAFAARWMTSSVYEELFFPNENSTRNRSRRGCEIAGRILKGPLNVNLAR